MRALLESLLAKPTIWIVVAVSLAVADLVAPTRLAVCTVHMFLLPIAWRLLHRRHVSLLTATLMVATVLPGLAHLVMSFPTAAAENADSTTTIDIIEPARIWTTLALAASGLFHINLQRARRRRISLRRELQQKVRRRTDELRNLNQTLRDEVTKHQETQHLLTRSETNFQSVIDRMQLQVLRKNRDGVITYANDTFCQELGRAPGEVIGKLDSEIYPPEIAQSYRSDDLRVMETGRSVDHVEEHPAADGETGYAQVFKAPEYDHEGSCIGIQIIFWDVTEKHRGAIALRDSEARKRALFDAAGDAVLLSNHDEVIIEANPSASRLFATPVERLVGRQITEVINPVDRQPAFRWSALPQSERHKMTIRRANASQFDGEVSVHSIPMGNTTGMAIVVRDVTVEREAIRALEDAKAAAEAASRTKSEFMAGVSHELRTPLGGINGLADLLQGTPLSAQGMQYVQMIRQSGSQLSDVIEDILDFSAIEAGRVQINPEPMNIVEVVGDAFKSLAARAVDKPLSLAISINPQIPPGVVADPKRIRQIITNLAGNAIKFTPTGQVSLRLDYDSTRSSAESTAVLISIHDTGVGISEDRIDKVFEAFERGEEGTTRRFGGTGLGLSISNELVRRMNGNITVSSKVNVGSHFECRMLLPRADVERTGSLTEGSRFHRTVVSTGNDLVNQSISETLDYHLGDFPDSQANAPTLWVVGSHNSSQYDPDNRQPMDRVIWVGRLGESKPPKSIPSDIVLSQPVLPREIIDAINRFSRSDESIDTPSRDETVARIAPTRHLLLVDDSMVNQTVIRDHLLIRGFTVDVASSGSEAIQLARQNHYDCILMDLQMPDMDGTEATIHIREMYQQNQITVPPTIALTAHVTDEHRQQCADAGMVGFITKPIDHNTLIRELLRITRCELVQEKEPDAKTNPIHDGSHDWRDQISSRCGGRNDTVKAICEAFLAEVPMLIDQIRTSVEENDAPKLRTASHTLKSCLGYVAPKSEVEFAADIESRSGQPATILPDQVEHLESITNHWIQCVQQLQSELAN